MIKDRNEDIVDALIIAVKNDIRSGVNKERLMHSLSLVVDKDIYKNIRERI